MDRYVTHATFSLERNYPAPPARVFTAWADPAAKARWFAGGPDSAHELDFRVGGREVARGGPDGGQVMTVSVTTVEFSPAESGTQLVLTEQGTFLDGREKPAWREHGTAAQLDTLAAELTTKEEHR